jgi:hypothetical protein
VSVRNAQPSPPSIVDVARKLWLGVRYMQAGEDAKLLDLAGEVAREVQK